jgi:hypothetical protein
VIVGVRRARAAADQEDLPNLLKVGRSASKKQYYKTP